MAGTPNTITSKLSAVPVKGPTNLLHEYSIKWQVTMGDNLLYVALLSTASPATFNPFAVICAQSNHSTLKTVHSPDAPLTKPDKFAAYSPYYPWGEGNKRPTKLGVVPAHGNEGLRMCVWWPEFPVWYNRMLVFNAVSMFVGKRTTHL
jgi:hypothetical protein